ncbi:MAG: carbohydrate-binding domain-containing protein [Acholeplasmatales bacterium]|nr:carbohydrate-binding domain-containing protein [Acholeplasmatales bacterium]
MKRKKLLSGIFSIALLCSIALTGCSLTSGNNTTTKTNVTTTSTASSWTTTTTSSPDVITGTDGTPTIATRTTTSTVTTVENNEEFSITTDGGLYTVENGVYKITSAGVYVLSGNLSDGMIYIEVGEDDEVELDLNNVVISSTTNSPIYCVTAGKLKIKALDNTTNKIDDARATTIAETDTLGTAAVYAECDLSFVGKGTLIINGNYNNGVHTKDDLSIKNQTLSVKAYNNALKGNDSITIESGNITVISTGGDALKTTNSDLSNKGNQRGIITISGGEVRIYACEDGIDAAYDVDINTSAYVEVYTGSYSSYSSTHAVSQGTNMYIAIPSSYYNSNYRYAIYFYNDDASTWVNASYETTVTSQSGRSRTTYYLYKVNAPTNYTNMAIYRFTSTQTENSTTTYDSCTSGGVINTSANLYMISSVSSGKMSGSWSNYSTSSSSEYSVKGIKADNEINISGETTVIVKSPDDALHANYGDTLENSETGKGNVNISGGSISITAGDDGIHADNELNISGGIITITNSHEGLEGNVITVSGGSTYVYANDDGVNATSSGEKKTPLVNVTGGYLDVTVGSGDTDGIDSNGNYTQTGGFVITKNPATDTSGNMASLDIDGTFTMTGGTFVALGVVSKTPSNYNYVLFGSTGGGNMWGGRPGQGGMGGSSSSVQFAKGTYTVSGTDITFTTTQTYYSLFIASDQLVVGSSYTLTGGTTKTWTQSSKATTAS